MNNGLTSDQLELLLYIETYRRLHGYAPTLEEIGAKVYANHTTVYGWCEKLIRMGYLVRNGRPNRCYVVAMDRLAAWAWREAEATTL